MTDTRRTAYWTTRQPEQPVDRTTCWARRCTNPATEHPRWIGAYCVSCLAQLERDAESEETR